MYTGRVTNAQKKDWKEICSDVNGNFLWIVLEGQLIPSFAFPNGHGFDGGLGTGRVTLPRPGTCLTIISVPPLAPVSPPSPCTSRWSCFGDAVHLSCSGTFTTSPVPRGRCPRSLWEPPCLELLIFQSWGKPALLRASCLSSRREVCWPGNPSLISVLPASTRRASPGPAWPPPLPCPAAFVVPSLGNTAQGQAGAACGALAAPHVTSGLWS